MDETINRLSHKFIFASARIYSLLKRSSISESALVKFSKNYRTELDFLKTDTLILNKFPDFSLYGNSILAAIHEVSRIWHLTDILVFCEPVDISIHILEWLQASTITNISCLIKYRYLKAYFELNNLFVQPRVSFMIQLSNQELTVIYKRINIWILLTNYRRIIFGIEMHFIRH